MRVFLPAFLALLALASQAGAKHSLEDDLIYRINFGSSQDVQMLLDKGADANAKTNQGEPVIDVAIERNDAETANMVKSLIDKGADVEVKDKAGYTPLMNAMRFKQHAVVKLLLEHHADYHVRTPEGMTILDYAKHYGDTESVDQIQSLYNKEAAYQASLRTPERFKEIIDKYAKDSCAYQYWNYFISSRQDPARDTEVKARIDKIHKDLNDAIIQIEKYYTATSQDALQKVSGMAVDNIYKLLDSMVSNRNRAESGIGKDEDEKERCDQIVADMHINFVGTLRNDQPAQPEEGSSGTEAPSPTTPLMPIDSPSPPGMR